MSTSKKGKSRSRVPAKKSMTADAVRRIKSATAKREGGQVPADSFAARAERAAAIVDKS